MSKRSRQRPSENSLLTKRFTPRMLIFGVALIVVLLIGTIAAVASSTATISGLTSQISSLNSRIQALESAFNSLMGSLTQLQAPLVVGTFNYTTSGCGSLNCTYQITGAYANMGVNTATGLPDSAVSQPCSGSTSQTVCTGSVLLRFTLYSNPDKTGTILCQSPYYILGQVNGRTLQSWSGDCLSSSSQQAESLHYQFIS